MDPREAHGVAKRIVTGKSPGRKKRKQKLGR